MFPVYYKGPMEGSVGSMAGRSKNLCFSTSNRGVEVDLTWKNKGQIDGGVGWGHGREVEKPLFFHVKSRGGGRFDVEKQRFFALATGLM